MLVPVGIWGSDGASLGIEADVRTTAIRGGLDAMVGALKAILDRLGME
jgi:hypothetical protein